jgi:cytochrome o ubiquinol oxidase subunit IV
MNKTSHYPVSHDHADDSSHGSLRSYVIGMVMSLALTLASFGVVMTHVMSHDARLAIIVVLCVVQLIVQLVFFLHIGTSRDQRANTGIFLCTGFLIAVIVGLSLWVMHNANENMMPSHMSIERAMAKD